MTRTLARSYCDIVLVSTIRYHRQVARDPVDYLLLLDLLHARYAVSRYFDDALDEAGLSTADFALYTMISVAGPVTPQRLSQWTGMPPTTMSAKVRRLVESGHGIRQRNDADGRSYTLTLSPAGLKAHTRALALFVDAFERFAATLPQEIEELRGALRSLATSARVATDVHDRPEREPTSFATAREFASIFDSPESSDLGNRRGESYRELFLRRRRRVPDR